MRVFAITLILFTLCSGRVSADDDSSKGKEIDAGTLSGLTFRSIGPALMSGRISDIAVDPTRPNTWYVAVGSGNLWKTVNSGTTWTPIFDSYPSYSIGCVSIDPINPDTIWVGTGEDVGGRHVGFGDGVYVSRNGGKSFEKKGLEKSEHIAKILIDPRDSNVVFVAAQGPLWSPGGERGLFKSTDGGETWETKLAKGPYTGVTSVVMDPRNPDVLYAATHQRHRTVWALMNAGPESGIHKSTDGGETWRELKTGLPGGDKGKMSLAVSPQKPDVVYVTVELAGRTGGFYRSTDMGESWTKMSDYVGGGTGPHYYQEIWADPHRFDVVYHANVRLGRTIDGGVTWGSPGNSTKHVDNHAVAFHPTDPQVLLVGCDGGLYRSYDQGATYTFTANLPLTQFYKVSVDYDWPVYHIVGGTQDNNTQYGPTRTLNRNGIRNSDWRITIGGDGHDCAIDPEDPNIIYCESQQGYLSRFDRRTGESVSIRPQPGPGEDNFRFNWDSPIHISPHSNTRLYFGSKMLHCSDDRGDSWTSISGDLSRGLDRFLLPIMGRVWSIDAAWDLLAMSKYGNITSISESPVVEGLIYVGTDDGLIQVTEDGGGSWRRIEKIYGIPEGAFVNDIKADLHDPDAVFATLDNHKEGDYSPYIIKSTDRGRTWESVTGDLPARHLVWRVIQDHVKPNLLFAATEFGIFVTLDGGVRWIQLKSGLPTISFRDLEIQRRENDLVGASFGRSFYILDDYTPLRHIDGGVLNDEEFVLFPVKKTLLYIEDDALGGSVGSQGNSFYTAANPPYGAVFTYYNRDGLEDKKQARHKKEATTKKAGGDNPYPGWEALKEEDREVAPMMVFEISDSNGNVIDRIPATTGKGFQRSAWNLRYAPFTSGSGMGPLVTPGVYRVQAYKRVNDETTALGEPQEFEVVAVGNPTLPVADRKEVLEYQQKLGTLQRDVTAATSVLGNALTQVREATTAIGNGNTDRALIEDARKLEVQILDAQESLTGDATKGRRSATGAPSVSSRLQGALFGTLFNTNGPTKTHRQQYDIARQEYEAAIDAIRTLIDVDLKAFNAKLDAAGVPWTAGRGLPK